MKKKILLHASGSIYLQSKIIIFSFQVNSKFSFQSSYCEILILK